ncbi:MAG: hypothetical protein J5J06_03170 [Phycisphaerae bacterium]|nr:hypothetical protein [Phycisphaerae bacterium]
MSEKAESSARAKSRRKSDHFVADGRERVEKDLMMSIRAEVEARFADQLHEAGWWRRWRLRRQIDREIRVELKKQRPSREALFANN